MFTIVNLEQNFQLLLNSCTVIDETQKPKGDVHYIKNS